MSYLERRTSSGELVRGDLRLSLPWARSVVVCAINYNAEGPRSMDAVPHGAGWIARYAWSGRRAADGTLAPADYHDELLARLRQIEGRVQGAVPNAMTRAYVDTGPLLERGLAARAGVGWIGRNTCVLNQQLGSFLLLAVLVTSLELPSAVAALPAADRCGTCTRCIDACPTGALLDSEGSESGEDSASPAATRQMDASRCIAYLTIEKKGAIPEELREPMGRQVFGCDICQEVCPWNRRAPIAPSDRMPARSELLNPRLAEMAALDGPAFNRRFRGSPVERTGRRRLHRNVAIAMGNSGDPAYVPQLTAWADGPPLANTPEDPVLRDAASWALRRILLQQETRGGARRPEDCDTPVC
jgi:epoxyqueuosine reductase